MRRLVAVGLVLPALLAVAACSGSAPAAKGKVATPAAVKVTGPYSSAPKVDFKAPLRFKKTASRTIIKGPGTGPAVQKDSLVSLSYVAMDASDGSVYDSTWPSPKPRTFALNSVIKGLGIGLAGSHVGDRVLVCINSKDAYDPTGNGGNIHKGDSIVIVADVKKVANPLPHAEGSKVSLPANVPPLTLAKNGDPARFVPNAKTTKKVSSLGVYPLIRGNGPTVKYGQTVLVNYLGQIYPGGSIFDSSWSRHQPLAVRLVQGKGGVIAGWVKGLVGQPVGSRVVLVVPPGLGYGKQGSPPAIPGKATLIFVIDILQAY